MSRVLRLFFFAACTMLAACGWQLRGFGSNAGYFAKAQATTGSAAVDLQFIDRNVELRSVFNKVLKQSEIQLAKEAPVTLLILREDLDRRPLAVTDTGVTAQYQLVLTIYYRYTGDVTTEPTPVSTWRNYDFDPKLISAKSQEENALVREMREELAVRILAAAPSDTP